MSQTENENLDTQVKVGDIVGELVETPSQPQSAEQTPQTQQDPESQQNPGEKQVTEDPVVSDPHVTPAQNVKVNEEHPISEVMEGDKYVPYKLGAICLTSATTSAQLAVHNSRVKQSSLNANWAQAYLGMSMSTGETDHEDAITGDVLFENVPHNTENRYIGITNNMVQASQGQVGGVRGQQALRNFMGMGSSNWVPLFGSGFHIKINDPGDLELLEFAREHSANRAKLGRETYGIGFSNRSIFTLEAMSNLVLRNLSASTVKDGISLLDNIVIGDYVSLVWGLAGAVYMNGFDYYRPCVADIGNCNHILHERINVARAAFYTTSNLTKEQMAQMSIAREPGKLTAEDLERYRNGFLGNNGSVREVKTSNNKKLLVTLCQPTLAQAIKSGNMWISKVNELAVEALGVTADPLAREVYIQKLASVTAACQYRHWVKSIDFEGCVISSEEDLDSAFRDTLSGDQTFVDNLELVVTEYMRNMITTIIGVRNYSCPMCKKYQMVEPSGEPAKIAVIDPVDVFLSLMSQRTSIPLKMEMG